MFRLSYASCDHTFKASAHFTDNVLDPKTRDSFRADEAAFTTAYRTNKPYWAWLEEPGNERDLQLFGLGMEGMSTVFNRDSGLGFDWKSVKEGGLVVDVGGGFGSYAMAVAKKNHHLKFVIQDREPVLKQAREVSLSPFSQSVVTQSSSRHSSGTRNFLKPSLQESSLFKRPTSSSLSLSPMLPSSSCASFCTTGPTTTARGFSEYSASPHNLTPSSS